MAAEIEPNNENDEDSEFTMIERVNEHDYFVRHGEQSRVDHSESGLSFLAKVSPEKTENYSSSIMYNYGLEEESSSFTRV